MATREADGTLSRRVEIRLNEPKKWAFELVEHTGAILVACVKISASDEEEEEETNYY